MIYRKLLLAAMVVSLCGCANMGPNIFHPGPAPLQQARAMRFDPYPEPDVGPPVLGGRPREYQVPVPEPVRNQPWWNRFGWGWGNR